MHKKQTSMPCLHLDSPDKQRIKYGSSQWSEKHFSYHKLLMVNFNFCDISKIIKDITPVLSLIVVFQLCFSGIKNKTQQSYPYNKLRDSSEINWQLYHKIDNRVCLLRKETNHQNPVAFLTSIMIIFKCDFSQLPF